MTEKELNALVANREEFNSYLYVSVEEALNQIELRKDNFNLKSYIDKSVNFQIPEILKDKRALVLFRHVATPNYEIARFITATAAIPGFVPVILEFTSDRFLSRNIMKHSLGKLRFQKGLNKNGQPMVEAVTIINFEIADNIPIAKLQTIWGQSLVDFHHEMLFEKNADMKDQIYDMSDWLKKIGTAKDYYKKFLTLFLKDAILFENFMLDDSEKNFTTAVIVPAFNQIIEECGCKPLVVALVPTDLEGEGFWLSHPYDYREKLKVVPRVG